LPITGVYAKRDPIQWAKNLLIHLGKESALEFICFEFTLNGKIVLNLFNGKEFALEFNGKEFAFEFTFNGKMVLIICLFNSMAKIHFDSIHGKNLF
jgi:hypothetical protein